MLGERGFNTSSPCGTRVSEAEEPKEVEVVVELNDPVASRRSDSYSESDLRAVQDGQASEGADSFETSAEGLEVGIVAQAGELRILHLFKCHAEMSLFSQSAVANTPKTPSSRG